MQFKVLILGLASAALVAAQNTLTINTPTSLITCVPTLLQWTGGVGPYYLFVNQGGSTSSIIETLVNNQNVNSYTWVVNLPAGTSVTVAVRDSTGANGYAQQVTIVQGSSTSCSSSSASGAGGASTGSGSSSSAPASSSSSSMSMSSSSSMMSSSTMTSTVLPTTSSAMTTSARPSTTAAAANAAPTNVVNAGAALAVAAVAAAFL